MFEGFKHYLEKLGEVGYVEQIVHSVVYVKGLPGAHPQEIVVFENEEIGQVLSLSKDYVEILQVTGGQIQSGAQVARTENRVNINVSNEYLGRAVDPLGRPIDSPKNINATEARPIESEILGISMREQINEPLETGLAVIDLVIPLAKGQRELVIGDRKTGKSQFFLQTLLNQAQRGTICIYALIGQKQLDIKRLIEYIKINNIDKNTVIFATSSSDPSGLIFLTPYSAMTLAEYFRDQGKDVLLILDDLTTHARYYREISLLARRFPGRNSYPGDIFYIHSRLLERAGNFKNGSITCLSGAESVMGDLSGYIQTNIMAMTDGHIFFDIDLYTQGRRPAVNPFLSVTRVGHQAQTPLQKDISRQLSSFLVQYDRMTQFMHFGAEIGEKVRRTLDAGNKLLAIFNQSAGEIVPINANVILIAALWAGVWKESSVESMEKHADVIATAYSTDDQYKKQVDQFIEGKNDFSSLINAIRQDDSLITERSK